jgi:hypothetical protein
MMVAVPSDVVGFIEAWLSLALLQTAGASITIHGDSAGPVRGIIDLVRAIPEQLLLLEGSDRTKLMLSLARLEVFVERATRGQPDTLGALPGVGDSPLRIIWNCMKKCPDDAPPANLRVLPFVHDADLRSSIERDLGAAHTAVASDSFKAATVLAGAGIEALLLWAMQDGRVFPGLATFNTPPANPAVLANWHLNDLLAAAKHVGLLSSQTAKAIELAKDYRNLIHPGRAQRLGERCDRGSAFGALGALHRLIVDLQQALP